MLNKKKIVKSAAILIVGLISLAIAKFNETYPTTSTNTGSSSQSIGIDLSQKWSQSSPEINIHHVFLGEINSRGKPTGFHSRPNGQDPKSARIKQVKSKPNKAGVYTAQIEVFDKSNNQWREKFSSIFPDKLSANEVINAILHAYKNRDKSKKQPWSGPSGLGFAIQGYVLNNGKINTAFPVYTRD